MTDAEAGSEHWAALVRRCRALAEKYRCDGSTAWFRGCRKSSFELQSTLHRYVDRLTFGLKPPLSAEDRVDVLRADYKMLYRRFKSDAWPLLGPDARSEWGVIFAMQHFGLPTRLLDWTESFACAVFFAQSGRQRSDDAAIWVLDAQALNLSSIKTEGVVALDEDMTEGNVRVTDWHPKWAPPAEPLPSIAGFPIFTNPRMTAQRSRFTLSGDSDAPLDKEFPNLVAEERLVKVILPAATYDCARNFLSAAGADAFSFYPDLHGLALRHEAETDERIDEFRRCYPEKF